jgi:hypothetical protein
MREKERERERGREREREREREQAAKVSSWLGGCLGGAGGATIEPALYSYDPVWLWFCKRGHILGLTRRVLVTFEAAFEKPTGGHI